MRGGDFNQLARLMVQHDGNFLNLRLIVHEVKGLSPRVATIVKTAVDVGGTTEGNWAAPLGDYAAVSAAWLESLRPFSVFDRMLADGIVRVPLKTRISIVTGSVTGYGIAQANVKPISSLSLAADTIEPRKAVATIVISEELAKFATPAAEKLFNAELKKGVAAATDSVFLSGLAVGVTPSASAGSSAANVLTDLQTLLAAVTTGPNSRLYFIVDATNAKKLVTKTNSSGAVAFAGMGINGGEILPGVQALVSDQLAANTAMLVDATGIIGETSNVDLKMARHATMQFDDAPDSPPTALTGMVSLWQYNLRALMAERWFGFSKARSTAVAMLSGVNY